jgi:hypothetical protein
MNNNTGRLRIAGKERFVNAGGECIVMERSERVPSTALVFRPCNTLTPYIVVTGHKPGQTSWEHGKYFGSLTEAVKELASWDEPPEDEDEPPEYAEYSRSNTAGDYSPSSPWGAPGMNVRDFI